MQRMRIKQVDAFTTRPFGGNPAGVITEADTCREFVTPKLIEAGWGTAPHAIGEQRSFTNGRIIVAGGKVRRGKQKMPPGRWRSQSGAAFTRQQ